MMVQPRALTSLAEIRSLELEMARRIDDARQRGDAAVTRANQEARRVVAAGHERGVLEAEEHRRERLAAADAEADRIRVAGQSDAAVLLIELRPRLLGLIDAMLELLLTTRGEEGGA